MSQIDETSPNPVEILPSVKRNGITKTLTKAVFSPKSDTYKGSPFFYPQLEEPKIVSLALADGSTVRAITSLADLEWFGLDQVTGATNKVARQVFGTMVQDNMKNNEGILNMEEFLVDAAEFTAARQSLSDLRDELDDLQALQQQYSMDENFGAEVEITDENGAQQMVKTPRAQELEKLIKANADKIRPLRVKIDALRKQYELVAEKRAETKSKNEAAKALAKGGQVATA